MAAGDEKIDVFDQVQLKNRLTDHHFETKFDGKDYRWEPGQVRSIPRAYSTHFLNKSTYHWDPTETEYPDRSLVLIGPDGKPVDAGADASPLTWEETKVLDLINEKHLPDNRYMDDEGRPMAKKVYRSTGITPTSGAPGRRPLDKGAAEWNRPEGRGGLDEAAEAAAVAKV